MKEVSGEKISAPKKIATTHNVESEKEKLVQLVTKYFEKNSGNLPLLLFCAKTHKIKWIRVSKKAVGNYSK